MRIGEFLASLDASFPQRVAHGEFLGQHTATSQIVNSYVAVFILLAQLLLCGAVALVAEGVVGIEVDVSLAHLSYKVKVHLMERHALGSFQAVVCQMVVDVAIGLQVIVIVAPSLHVVVGVLIEAAKRIVIVKLVVEAEAAFEEWIVNLVPLLVGNYPQRVGKDGLFELAFLPPLVVSAKEVGKQFQSSLSIGEVDTLIVRKAVPFAAPRR